MKESGIAIAIILGIALLIFLFFWLKPYFIKHDTTILFSGGLGSGKTLETVKTAMVLVRKQRILKYYLYNFNNKWLNKIYKLINKCKAKKYTKITAKYGENTAEEWIIKHPYKIYRKDRKKPMLYSNIPIHYRTRIFGFKKEWAIKLEIKHIMLLKEINEYSVVVIDEFPQFISQFDWDVELVQKNCNEFITFFRHYIGGFLCINAQSEEEIECHFRRKLNQGIFCFDLHVWPCRWIPLFYTNRMCDYIISENIQTMSTTYIEENTRLHFGLFPRKAYDTRCYRPRYKNVHIRILKPKEWKKLQTVEVLRLRKYVSPLDSETTPQQKDRMEQQAESIMKGNKDNEN